MRSFLSLLACWLVIGLSIASCGGMGTSATSSSTDSMTLKVADVTNGMPFFPFYIALQKNYFKAQGLTLDPTPVPQMGSGAKLAAAVESGSIDLAVGGITDVFTISRVDAYIKIVGSITDDFLLDVVASKSFEQQTHLTASSSLADKVKALKGKKVGISAPNSASDALVTYLFRQQGLDAQRDVTKVNLGAAIPTDLAAVKAGRVDAVVVSAPAGEIAETQGFGDTFISPTRGDVPGMSGLPFGVAYARQPTIDAKPKAIQAFIRGLAQGEEFIQNNPTQMVPFLQAYLKLDQKTADNAWNATKVSMPQSPQVTQQSFNIANQFQVSGGLIAVALPYKDLVAADTINKALS